MFVLHPGCEEAVLAGCTCPVEENFGGKGINADTAQCENDLIFLIDSECPWHGKGCKCEAEEYDIENDPNAYDNVLECDDGIEEEELPW